MEFKTAVPSGISEARLSRPRSCGALIRADAILMVMHRDADRTYWTLPGGGVEVGESFAEAAVREMFEETGLRTRAVRLLWSDTYGPDSSPDECYLLELEDEGQLAVLGIDPEEAHLSGDERLLQGMAWRALDEVSDDLQVARVLDALGLEFS